MGKDIFFVADLCQIINSKNMKNKHGTEFMRFFYRKIDRKIFYFKNGKYIDIDTKKAYGTSHSVVGDFYIDPVSIVPFTVFLRENKVNYNGENLNKKRVKKLYEDINKDKSKK